MGDHHVEGLSGNKKFLMMPNRMNVSFTRPSTKLIVVGSKALFRVIPADRDEQFEHVVNGRTVLRSKGIALSNHFKRWYFHVKASQRIVDARELAAHLPCRLDQFEDLGLSSTKKPDSL